jgi:hypothetical protein
MDLRDDWRFPIFTASVVVTLLTIAANAFAAKLD